MFNGIIETTGVVLSMEMKQGCQHFVISPKQPFNDLILGESIAVNGVCLTVTDFTPHQFAVTVVPETLRLTNLNQLTVNGEVNLERALIANSRISGHYVQGHVDGMGEILEINRDKGDALLVKISLPTPLNKYVVTKGYIALDGMSITVIDVTPDYFTVTFIPHTQQITIIKQYQKGLCINLEVDMLGKYIEKLVGAHTCQPPLNASKQH